MMKKVLLLFAIMLGLTPSVIKAQGASSGIEGKVFNHSVCDVSANSAIDLGKDVDYGSGSGLDLNVSGGEWHLLNSGSEFTDDASGSPTAEELLASYKGEADNRFDKKVGNVLNMVGLPAGTYTFVYTATNSACLTTGSMVGLNVSIVETAKDISHVLYICPDDAFSFDLRSILSPTLKNIVFNTDLASQVNLPNSITGTAGSEVIVIPYDDGTATTTPAWEGTFSLEYQNGDACSDWATMYVTVRRDVDKFKFVNSAAMFCITHMPAAINLTNLAGASVGGTGGTSPTAPKWIKNTTSTTGTTSLTLTDDGDVTFTSTLVAGDYAFDYTYYDCDDNLIAKTFILTLSDDLSGQFVSKDKNICKSDYANRVYNLMTEGFGINVPNNSGTWTVVEGVGTPDVTNGLFAVKHARIGTYKFKFKFSNSTQICMLQNKEATLTLKVGDVGDGAVSDGRVQLCSDLVDAGVGSLMLNDFVPGIGQVSNIEWKWGENGSVISSSSVAYSDLKALGVGVQMFTFTYTSPGCDGVGNVGNGKLYVDITSSVDMNNVTLKYCRPDLPTVLNLNSAIGVDVPGSWEWVGTSPTTAELSDLATGVPSSSNFILFKEIANTSGNMPSADMTYIIKFKPVNSTCGAKEVILTLKVSDTTYN